MILDVIRIASTVIAVIMVGVCSYNLGRIRERSRICQVITRCIDRTDEEKPTAEGRLEVITEMQIFLLGYGEEHDD